MTLALAVQYKTAANWSDYAAMMCADFGGYFFYIDGTTTDDAAYAVADTDDLNHLAAAVNANKKTSGLKFRQTADITFTGVTITSTTPTEVTSTADGGKVKFVGQYSPFTIGNNTSSNTFDGDLNEILFVGSGSQIGYSASERRLKCFRAHFWVQPHGDGSQAAQLIDVDWGEGSTGIREIEAYGPNGANGANEANRPYKTAWYSLDGRQLSGKPTAKGLYIHNGRKTVIK